MVPGMSDTTIGNGTFGSMNVRIQAASRLHISGLARLCGELGYPLKEAEILRNLLQVNRNKDSLVLVALSQSEVVGWIQVCRIWRLESGVFAEIVGLVVQEDFRGQGIGTRLVEQARRWGLRKRCARLRVRCNLTRRAAHQFYRQAGFTESKRQMILDLPLK